MERRRNRKAQEAPTLPEGYRWGKDISPEEMQYDQVAVSPEGRATGYLGYFDLNHQGSPFLYSVCVGARTEEARRSYRFLELRAGCLHLSSFLSDSHAYRILKDRNIRLPRGAETFFGVYGPDWELDEELTRHFFGATFSELEVFLEQFYATIRYPLKETWGWRPVRITFSKSRDNDCDLSGAYIPQKFPFIAFGDTTYFGGHVSLSGFYRHLAFLRHYHRHGNEIRGEAFFQRLVENGAKPEVIVQLCEAAFAGGANPIFDPMRARYMMESLNRNRL
jgi:hypothetical protein